MILTLPQMIYGALNMDQIAEPGPEESMQEFKDRMEAAEASGQLGDTLPLFVVRELNDPHEDYEELMARISRAADELHVLLDVMQRNEPTAVDG